MSENHEDYINVLIDPVDAGGDPLHIIVACPTADTPAELAGFVKRHIESCSETPSPEDVEAAIKENFQVLQCIACVEVDVEYGGVHLYEIDNEDPNPAGEEKRL